MEKLTKEQFIERTLKESNMTREDLLKAFDIVPCCGEYFCNGWELKKKD